MFRQLKKDKTDYPQIRKVIAQGKGKDLNTFSIEGRPNSARVADFDGDADAQFSEFYRRAQTNIFNFVWNLSI